MNPDPLRRAACAALALGALGAAFVLVGRLRGDLLLAPVPPVTESTTVAQAVHVEPILADGLKRNPWAWESRIHLASYLGRQKRYSAALEQLREALAQHEAIQGRELEAKLLFQSGDAPGARAAFERLGRISTVDRAVFQYRMLLAAGAADWAGLEPIATEAAERWPGSADAQASLGNAAAAAGDSELATKHYRLALGALAVEGAKRPKPAIYRGEDLRGQLQEEPNPR